MVDSSSRVSLDDLVGTLPAQLADEENAEAVDLVNHPPHYTWLPSGIEVIDITEHLSFNVGNAVKYILRADHKGEPLQDLNKALWYLQREIGRRQARDGSA